MTATELMLSFGWDVEDTRTQHVTPPRPPPAPRLADGSRPAPRCQSGPAHGPHWASGWLAALTREAAYSGRAALMALVALPRHGPARRMPALSACPAR